MVAITVILAAVIGTTVLGFGGQVNENAQAGVNIDNKGDSTQVTVVSLSDADYVKIRISGDSVAFDEDGGIKEGPIKMNATGSTINLPKPTERDSVKVSGSGVSYLDASGGSLSWEKCPDGTTGAVVCETNDGILDDGSGGFASDIPEGAEATITVVAGKGDPSDPDTETTVLVEDVTL
jgi:FlaG/FlaF family flagellin (archaellin)